MDPQITYTLLGGALMGVGWMIKEFRRSWKEAQEGRKDEAEKMANERDAARAEAKAQYADKRLWQDATYATRQVAMEAGVHQEDLPKLPHGKD